MCSARQLWQAALILCPHRLIRVLADASVRRLHHAAVRWAPPVTTHVSAVHDEAPSHPTSTASLLHSIPSARLSSLVTVHHASQLSRFGFTVIDGAVGDAFCSALERETRFLHANRLLLDNHTHLVTRGSQQPALLPKRGIHEADVHTPGLAALIPAHNALARDLSLLRSVASVLPSLGLRSQSVKAQLNSGEGACFPLHFDGYGEGEDSRRITAILYLNRAYAPSHGGQLRLFPIPYAPVTIEPRWDRLVLFSTPSMLHRVLPSRSERLCVTVWMAGQPAHSAPLPSLPPTSSPPSLLFALSCLLHSRLYPHYCKLLLAEPWAHSVVESHPPSADAERAVGQHWKDVEVIRRTLAPWTQHVPEGLLAAEPGEDEELSAMDGLHWGSAEETTAAAEQAETIKRSQPPITWSDLHRFVELR